MKIGLASDHRGYHLKQKLIEYLKNKKYETIDLGCDSVLPVDYPDYALLLTNNIINGNLDLGIAICGTGIGMSIACNKVNGIRCAKIDSAKEALLSKKDNNANIISLNGSMPLYKAKDIMDSFLAKTSQMEERHLHRLEKIAEIERNQNR